MGVLVLHRAHHAKAGVQAAVVLPVDLKRPRRFIVFAALAVSRWIEDTTGWSIRRFVKTARRYRTIDIDLAGQTITAADPLPDDLATAIEAIKHRATAH